jgi:hypothetical protein
MVVFRLFRWQISKSPSNVEAIITHLETCASLCYLSYGISRGDRGLASTWWRVSVREDCICVMSVCIVRRSGGGILIAIESSLEPRWSARLDEALRQIQNVGLAFCVSWLARLRDFHLWTQKLPQYHSVSSREGGI